MTPPMCGECGQTMELRVSDRYTYPSGEPRKFWSCSAYPRCCGTHGAHPDGTPLGIPADKQTKIARTQAHNVFDRYWRTLRIYDKRRGRFKRMDRGTAYKWLEDVMGLNKGQAHIGNFNLEQCEHLIKLITELENHPDYLPS